MENSEIILSVLSLIAGLISSVIAITDIKYIKKEIKAKRILNKSNYNDSKKVIENFNVLNKGIDVLVNENKVNLSKIEIYKSQQEIVKKYIDVLYNCIEKLYNDDSISVSVMLFDKENMILSNYLTINEELDSKKEETSIEIQKNEVFNNIINNKYQYAFITKYNNNTKRQNIFDEKSFLYKSFISYPIQNSNDDKPVGLINITSQNGFYNAKLNKIIIHTVSETAKDLSELNLKNQIIIQ